MKRIALLSLCSTLLLSSNYSDIDKDLLQGFEDVSEIATKTKLNVDSTPSFVTVLHGDKLQKIGISSVYEAIGLVQGVQLIKERSGVPVVVFRGAIQKGEVKFMINGVTINNAYRGSIYHFLDFPIELVKRIEVIRGAGSVLYGSGAISGVVNIITHSQEFSENKVFATYGSYDYHKVGAVASYDFDETKVAIDGYYDNNDKFIATGPDRVGNYGDSDQTLQGYSFGINISKDNLSFHSRIKSSKLGNSHGIAGYIDTSKNEYNNPNSSYMAEIKYNGQLDTKNNYSLSAGYVNYKQEIDAYTYENVDSKYAENTFFVKSQLVSKSIENNELLVGLEFEKSKVLNSSVFVKDGSKRDIYTVYINDSYGVTDSLDVSMGLRHEKYIDYISNTSTSLGAVYKINDKLNLKATYTNSFRVPSWVELKSSLELEEEKAKTIEAGLVYTHNYFNKMRVNVYSATIDNMIIRNNIDTYENSGKNTMQGVDFEYMFTPSLNNDIKLSAGYIDAKDKNSVDVGCISNLLLDLGMRYSINRNFNVAALVKYASPFKRKEDDTRDDLEQKAKADLTASYKLDGFTVSAVIKDILDSGTKYPLSESVYPNDYTDAGREFFVNFQYAF